jgi:hypothetical protein
MKKLLIAAIMTCASLSAFANSEDVLAHPLDTDKDGLISMEEAKTDSTLSALFLDLDVNQDGYLSQLELEVKTEAKTN